MNHVALLFAAGFTAGGMNALAGGGSFVTLPVLVAAGLPSIVANASSTVALYPAGLASVWVYRRGLGGVCGVPLRPTLLTTLIGGLAGALLLLWTPSRAFDQVVPWLLLLATLALAFGRRIGPILRARFRAGLPAILLIQFLLGIYGGYFGGAVGLMMMAAWNLLDAADIKSLNAPRVLLVSAANSVAVFCFAIAGAVDWRAAVTVCAGAIVGAVGGALLGRRIRPGLIRALTLLVAVTMTALFFRRAYVG